MAPTKESPSADLTREEAQRHGVDFNKSLKKALQDGVINPEELLALKEQYEAHKKEIIKITKENLKKLAEALGVEGKTSLGRVFTELKQYETEDNAPEPTAPAPAPTITKPEVSPDLKRIDEARAQIRKDVQGLSDQTINGLDISIAGGTVKLPEGLEWKQSGKDAKIVLNDKYEVKNGALTKKEVPQKEEKQPESIPLSTKQKLDHAQKEVKDGEEEVVKCKKVIDLLEGECDKASSPEDKTRIKNTIDEAKANLKRVEEGLQASKNRLEDVKKEADTGKRAEDGLKGQEKTEKALDDEVLKGRNEKLERTLNGADIRLSRVIGKDFGDITEAGNITKQDVDRFFDASGDGIKSFGSIEKFEDLIEFEKNGVQVDPKGESVTVKFTFHDSKIFGRHDWNKPLESKIPLKNGVIEPDAMNAFLKSAIKAGIGNMKKTATEAIVKKEKNELYSQLGDSLKKISPKDLFEGTDKTTYEKMWEGWDDKNLVTPDMQKTFTDKATEQYPGLSKPVALSKQEIGGKKVFSNGTQTISFGTD